MTDLIMSTGNAVQPQAQSHEQVKHLSAMFYKRTKVSLELQRESADDGEKTGCETGGASTADQAHQHMSDINDFINFQEDDSDDEAEQMEFSEASSISECSDSEDDNQITEPNAQIKAKLD